MNGKHCRDTMKPEWLLLFPLRQGHSVRGWQSNDCAERGNCIWSDSPPAWDGVAKHRDAHGLPESDCRVHLEWIRSPLLLQLKRQQSQTCMNVNMLQGLDVSLGFTRSLSATLKTSLLSWNWLKVSTSFLCSECFDVLTMYRNYTKWSSSRKYEARSTTVVPRFTPKELDVVIPGSIVFWQEVAPHMWKQVLPPVSQRKLITLSEKAWLTCSRSRFNLTSHILVVLFVQITVKNPWTNALILSLSVNASVFILENLIMILIVFIFKLQYVTYGDNCHSILILSLYYLVSVLLMTFTVI